MLREPSLIDLARDLECRRVRSRDLVERCLERITDERGEGSRVFLRIDADALRAAAEHHDAERARGRARSPFAGIPIAVKDNIDIAGEVTAAGSLVLANSPAAGRDAVCVARLRAWGFVPIGRTNMTEFAYSGLGLNPHHGTPLNPWDRKVGRVPGGSSSGATVAVSDGMAFGAIGTDTGGSCRIPAAFCGLAGFKPTTGAVPTQGVFPLSETLDCLGAVATTVSGVAVLNAALAGQAYNAVNAAPLSGMRLAILENVVLDDLAPGVAASFEAQCVRLERAGARLERLSLGALAMIARINAKGGFAAFESWRRLGGLLRRSRAQFDPRVASRIERGAEQNDTDYADILQLRAHLVKSARVALQGFSAVLMPTVAVTAPRLSELLTDDARYYHVNLLVLRNTSIANLLGAPAISVPAGLVDGLPVGLGVMGHPGADTDLLAIATGIEAALQASSQG
jgi:aspartyl-tRNA(Asn)/glutamyl-tRNA(Gln) amidotransferase subunit A